MKAKAVLTARLSDAAAGKSLSDVLAPDNEGLPRGMRLSVAIAGRTMELQVSSDSPSASLSTLLALLRDMTLFQEVWLLSSRKGARVQRS